MKIKDWYPEQQPQFSEAGHFEAIIFGSDRPLTSGKSVAVYAIGQKGAPKFTGTGHISSGTSGEYRGYTAAAVGAVESLPPNSTIDIFTHHDVTFKAFTKWLPGWRAKGWIGSNRKPVTAAEIFQRFLHVTETRNIHWKFHLIGPGDSHFHIIEQLRQEVQNHLEALGPEA
jgi:ribonuclease HI